MRAVRRAWLLRDYDTTGRCHARRLVPAPRRKDSSFSAFLDRCWSKVRPIWHRLCAGFAVKLYTKEGTWDLVGNNIPVFFIQDAIKFPDRSMLLKEEPDRGFPQAQTAHDNSGISSR